MHQERGSVEQNSRVLNQVDVGVPVSKSLPFDTAESG